eukprot:evm.model.scf_3770.1 EVM.evm.TU.scf_3770.1   scf_3770:7001-9027(-)
MAVREVTFDCGHLRIRQRMDLEDEAGAVVWDAALVLAHYLHHAAQGGDQGHSQWPRLKGKRVIELGGGTGFVGLAAALLGAKVTLTDLARVVPFIDDNIRDNGLQDNAKALPLAWGSDVGGLGPPFDYILASDVVYLKATYDDLITTIEALSGPHTTTLFAHERRVGTWEFFELLKKRNFLVQEISPQLQHPQWQSEDIALVEVRLRGQPDRCS